MTVDEAKGLFALMGWRWEARALNQGNLARGMMPYPWQGRYEVFVNEVMDIMTRNNSPPHTWITFERYDVNGCLTRYAELYLEFIAQTGGRYHEPQSKTA